MTPALVQLGADTAPHRVLISSIEGPYGTGEQGHALCLGCGWVSVEVVVKLAHQRGLQHMRDSTA